MYVVFMILTRPTPLSLGLSFNFYFLFFQLYHLHPLYFLTPSRNPLLLRPTNYPPRNRLEDLLVPRILLKKLLVHLLFQDLFHLEPILPAQVKKLEILLPQPGAVAAKDDIGFCFSCALESLPDGLDHIAVLRVSEEQIGEDEDVEPVRGVAEEGGRGGAPDKTVSDDIELVVVVGEEVAPVNVFLYGGDEVRVREVSADDEGSAQHGGHEGGEAGAGAEFADCAVFHRGGGG